MTKKFHVRLKLAFALAAISLLSGCGRGGTSQPQAVPGSAAVTLSSNSLNFATAVGSTSAAQTVTVTNSGNASLAITSISVSGANALSFAEATTCGASLAASSSCSISVTFSSSAAGAFAAALSIFDNAAGAPQTVSLAGNGQAPALQLSTSALNFMGPAESTSSAQTVTLKNSGTLSLSISSITLAGANAASFSESTTCGLNLPAGNTCAITVAFSPYLALANGYSASVVIASNATSGPTVLPLSGTATGTLTINTANAAGWTISTGAINLTWNSLTGNVVSIQLAGDATQLVDTTTLSSNGQPDGLYMDNTGTGTATCTPTYQQVGNEYIDFWQTCPSNSANAFTYSRHFVVTANDPGVHVYYVANHLATDIAGSLGQVQFLIRVSQTLFTNTYSNNTGLNNLGPFQLPVPMTTAAQANDPGRAVQNAVLDLHGIMLPSNFGRQFETKYDYSSYEYLHQEHGVYGTQYAAWTVIPSLETLSGGPTKQDLIYTGNILLMETFSSHLDNGIVYTPAQGVASTRLFGPYYFAFNKLDTTHTTVAALYAEAQQYLPLFSLLYDNDATLLSNNYVVSTGRGTVLPSVAGSTSSTANTAWTVLSDAAKNFQYSSNGLQYWVNDSTSGGTAPLSGVAPGTYRLSKYVLGQWGELRYDGVVVSANQTTTLPAMTFTPENFSTYTPIWTIGTPDRSAHEFLHGSNASGNAGSCAGCDDREYFGNWNYWQDFATNNGMQVYYATAEGSIPASTPTAMNYVLWQQFDPGIFAGVYNTADDTADGYQYAIPSYVASLPGASGTNGVLTTTPGMTIHFTTTSSQLAQGAYTVLSLGMACAEGSVIVTLNGSQSIWHYSNASDCMIRSGLAGYYEWGALEWPTSVLKPAGQDNVMTVTVSQPDGVMWDAMRLEIGAKSASPTVTGWHDYGYGNTGSTFTYQNDSVPNN